MSDTSRLRAAFVVRTLLEEEEVDYGAYFRAAEIYELKELIPIYDEYKAYTDGIEIQTIGRHGGMEVIMHPVSGYNEEFHELEERLKPVYKLAEEKIGSVIDTVASEIASDLNREYEYITSEEYALEMIEANGYRFDEYGHISDEDDSVEYKDLSITAQYVARDKATGCGENYDTSFTLDHWATALQAIGINIEASDLKAEGRYGRIDVRFATHHIEIEKLINFTVDVYMRGGKDFSTSVMDELRKIGAL